MLVSETMSYILTTYNIFHKHFLQFFIIKNNKQWRRVDEQVNTEVNETRTEVKN